MRPPSAAAALAGAVLLLSGCTSTVEVSVPGGSAGCGRLTWPQTVSGLEQRETSPSDPATAAWGDPAVIARCGVAALGPTDVECVEVDTVGWIPEPLSDGTRLTSFGTDPAIEVLVPASYGPAPLLLPVFSEVARSLPRNGLECR